MLCAAVRRTGAGACGEQLRWLGTARQACGACEGGEARDEQQSHASACRALRTRSTSESGVVATTVNFTVNCDRSSMRRIHIIDGGSAIMAVYIYACRGSVHSDSWKSAVSMSDMWVDATELRRVGSRAARVWLVCGRTDTGRWPEVSWMRRMRWLSSATDAK